MAQETVQQLEQWTCKYEVPSSKSGILPEYRSVSVSLYLSFPLALTLMNETFKENSAPPPLPHFFADLPTPGPLGSTLHPVTPGLRVLPGTHPESSLVGPGELSLVPVGPAVPSWGAPPWGGDSLPSPEGKSAPVGRSSRGRVKGNGAAWVSGRGFLEGRPEQGPRAPLSFKMHLGELPAGASPVAHRVFLPCRQQVAEAGRDAAVPESAGLPRHLAKLRVGRGQGSPTCLSAPHFGLQSGPT